MSNHVESLFAAVTALAGHGNIKQRLLLAYEEHIAGIDGDDLPMKQAQSLSELRERMTRVEPMNGEGPVCATVLKMSMDEACECATLVVRLYGDIARYVDDTQEMLPLAGHAAATPAVPPFLIRTSRARSG